MTIEPLAAIDLSAWSEPDPGLDQREFYEGWLRYQRHEFVRKLRDLSRDQLAAWRSVSRSRSVVGRRLGGRPSCRLRAGLKAHPRTPVSQAARCWPFPTSTWLVNER
jgi:hypothetical protein